MDISRSMVMTHEHYNEVEVMSRAVQSVLLKHNVPLWQHDETRRQGEYEVTLPSRVLHPYAVGDTIITIGAHPRDYGTWTKANHSRIETEIAAEVARNLGLRGLIQKQIAVRVASHNQMVRVEVTRPNPTVYGWEEIAQYAKDGLLIGRDQLRQPVLMDFERGVPGYLVTGASRSGKTNF